MVWWWWWQWQRALRIHHGFAGGYSRGLLWLPGFDMIVPMEIAIAVAAAAELVLNLRVTMLDQVIPLILVLPLLPFYLLLFSAHIAGFVEGVIITGAFFTLAAVVSVGVITWSLLSRDNSCGDHDSDY